MTPVGEFPYPLVSSNWLAASLGEPDLKVVDGSWRMPGNPAARADHERRRIPGAVLFDLDAIADHSTPLPHMLPPIEEFARAVGALGIAPTDRVVVYDDAGVFSAARVWWTFRVMGHDKVSVLDGGLPKWLQEGRDTETGVAKPSPASYRPTQPRNLARTAGEIRAMLKGGAGVVLDARPVARYLGEAPEPRPGLRSGHMPGAVSLPYSLVIADDGTLRPQHELARLFHDREIHAETPVVTTCGSGVTAAILSLALERVGHRNHGLYDGSWAEWGAETNDLKLFPVAAG